MFLEQRVVDYPAQDEWVLGFLLPGREQFLFYHEGVQLAELPDAINLSALGSTFYLLQVGRPFTLEEAVKDEAVFPSHYGLTLPVVLDKYLRFDAVSLDQFFRATAGDWFLECMIVGTHEQELSCADLARIVQAATDDQHFHYLADLRLSSILATHDNSFFCLEAQSLALLRRLLSESITGYFSFLSRPDRDRDPLDDFLFPELRETANLPSYPHIDAPVPEALLDLLLAEYHTTQLKCWPTVWSEQQNQLVPRDVQIDSEGVHVLLRTSEGAWITYQPSIPQELLGRGLRISYSFHEQSWSFEKWP
jgi:hypothetical protein